MKIGALGGTFDPIHIGHLLLGEFAYEQCDLDEIWFIPNGNPPHKNTFETGSDFKHRAEMVQIAIKDVPYFRLSMHEATHRVHYTYSTLIDFREMYPGYEFYFILGSDTLFQIETWKYFREIFPLCRILAGLRDDSDPTDMINYIEHLKSAYRADIELLRAPLLEVSSTTIRDRAAKGLTVRYMTPDSVAGYIAEHNLYGEKKQEI